jgi:alpha-beta hydrolase superfamily lysophospholipase
MQGWGRSPGVKKKRMGYVKSHDDYVRDVAATMISLRRKFPTLPIYGAGESLGATVLLRGQLTGVLSFNGLIMSGPGYRPNPSLLGIRGPAFAAKFGLWGAGIFGDYFPGWPVISTNIGLRLAICSPSVQKRMLKDPYVPHRWLPASYLSGLADSQGIIDKNLDKLSTPFLIIHGEKDNLIPLDSSSEIMRRAQTKDRELVEIKKGCHANLIETTSWPQAAKIMTTWLDAHVKKASVPTPPVIAPSPPEDEVLQGL